MVIKMNIVMSVTIVVGVLGAPCAESAVLVANPYDWDHCEAAESQGKIAGCARVTQVGVETTQMLAYLPEGDRSNASSDIETIRLVTNGPNTQEHGTRDQAERDLNKIIVYYNAAIRRDPKDDDAYFHRGLANFYDGFLPLALADLSQASKLDPEYPYYALWLDILDKRRNEPSLLPKAVARINMTKWPAPVVRLFLGQTTPAVALAAADDPDANTKKGQVCEANFYSGELALHQGVKEEAVRLFRLAAAGCPHGFVEGPAAYAELRALGVGP
jgi:tetratricopeptide (TPR) repeat protein